MRTFLTGHRSGEDETVVVQIHGLPMTTRSRPRFGRPDSSRNWSERGRSMQPPDAAGSSAVARPGEPGRPGHAAGMRQPAQVTRQPARAVTAPSSARHRMGLLRAPPRGLPYVPTTRPLLVLLLLDTRNHPLVALTGRPGSAASRATRPEPGEFGSATDGGRTAKALRQQRVDA